MLQKGVYMKSIKRIIASFLVIISICSSPMESLAAADLYDGSGNIIQEESQSVESIQSEGITEESVINDNSSGDSSVGLDNEDLTVNGTDSFGRLFSDALSDKASEQLENSGNNVFSVEIKGNVATVEYESLYDAELVVGIYEEDGIKILGTGKTGVLAEDTTASVTIDLNPMPQYFYVRAFLILPGSLEPLCTLYESPNYTKEMQEFFATTVDDFDKDLVLNLDNDKDENFLVYDDSVIRLTENDSVNTLVKADEDALTYEFNNVNDVITGLKAGDTVSYECNDGSVFIIQVADIVVSDNSVILKGSDTSLEDVFDFIKIDTESGSESGEATIDTTDMEEGVSYLGKLSEEEIDNLGSEYYEEIPNLGAKEGTGTIKDSFTFSFEKTFVDTTSYTSKGDAKKTEIKFKGTAGLDISASVKFYVSWSHRYLEVKLDYSLYGSVNISGKAEKLIPLGKVVIIIIPGVSIEFTPSIVLGVSGEIEFKMSIYGTIGRCIDNKEGWKNLTTKPQTKSELTAEFSVYYGLSMEPAVSIISSSIASASIEARVLIKLSGKTKSEEISDVKIHSCQQCILGEIFGEVSVSFKVTFLKIFSKSKTFEKTIKICDYYYSFDHAEFNFGTCPYQYYPVKFSVRNTANAAVKGTVISGLKNFVVKDGNSYKSVDSVTIDEFGFAEGYQQVGNKYTVTITPPEKYKETTEKYKVKSGKKNEIRFKVYMKDGNTEDDPVKPEEPDEPDNPFTPSVAISQVSLGKDSTAIVDSEGNMWIWGYCFGLVDGDDYSNVPVKVMTDVKKVVFGSANHESSSYIGVLKNDNSLWLWGDNNYGQLGNGTIELATSPFNVMNNVLDFDIEGGCSAAIKTDGSLWVWGHKYEGKEDRGGGYYYSNWSNVLTPEKVMESVKDVSIDSGCCAAVKKDNSLWVWGPNMVSASFGTRSVYEYNEEIEDYEEIELLSPTKVLDEYEIESISLSASSGITLAIVTTDGSMYITGGRWSGCTGTVGGSVDTPIGNGFRINKKIKDAQAGIGNHQLGILCEDQTFYLWGTTNIGYNDEDTEVEWYQYPEKIADGVAEIALNRCRWSNHDAFCSSDGNLWLWGNNEHGQIGNGNNKTVPSPTRISLSFLKEGITSLGSIDTLDSVIPLFSCFTLSENNEICSINNDANQNYETIQVISPETVAADNATSVRRAHFDNLSPYTNYNYYLLIDSDDEDLLNSSNILYIAQGTANGDGQLDITYFPRDDEGTSMGFIVKQWEYTEDEIQDGDIDVDSDIPDGLWMTGLESLTYDGTNQTQNVRVYDGKTLLTEKIDYSLSYKNNKDAYVSKSSDSNFDANKAPTLTVTMKGNYAGRQNVYFTIEPLSIDDVSFDAVMKKKGKTSVPTLLWNGKALKDKTDYKVNGNTVTGIGNFTGSVTVSGVESAFTDMSKVKSAQIDGIVYTGRAFTVEDIEPIFKDKLTFNGKTLVAGTDYRISKVINGTNVGNMTVVLQGLKNTGSVNGSFSGEKRISIKIVPYNVSGDAIFVTDNSGSSLISAEFQKGGTKPAIRVAYNGITLKQGRDYTVAYTNNKSAVLKGKNPTITVSGKGNFTGKKNVEFSIEQKPFAEGSGISVLASDIVMPKNPAKYQTKIQVFDNNGVLLKSGSDYNKNVIYKKGDTILNKSSIVAVGDEITVEITGSGKDYSADTITATYKILPADTDISKATISIKDQPYTGHAIKITGTSQIASATIGKSKTTLKISVDGGKTGDFIVVPGSYINNVQKGTAKVTLKGINGYGGYKTVTFKIGTRSLADWWKGLILATT